MAIAVSELDRREALRSLKSERPARGRTIAASAPAKLFTVSWLRAQPMMAEWRETVLRLQPECCECGSTKRLEADHIVTLSELAEAARDAGIATRDEALEHEPFWDALNGQTLCVLCHFEKTMGDAERLGWSRSAVANLFAKRLPREPE